MYKCFNCGEDAVIWNGDFNFSDYGYDGEGIVHQLTCKNCGAKIEYRCPIDNGDKEISIRKQATSEIDENLGVQK